MKQGPGATFSLDMTNGETPQSAHGSCLITARLRCAEFSAALMDGAVLRGYCNTSDIGDWLSIAGKVTQLSLIALVPFN